MALQDLAVFPNCPVSLSGSATPSLAAESLHSEEVAASLEPGTTASDQLR